MKERVVKRLHAELEDYEKQCIIRKLDVEQMLEKAYQIMMKREIVVAMEWLAEENGLVDYLWECLNEEEEVLDYLYQLWIGCDYTFVLDLAETIGNEIAYVHKH